MTVAAPNPLRIDPTRTATVRRMFESAVRFRFSLFRRALIKLVTHEDAFGLKITTNTRWSFETNPRKVDEFRLWLEAEILGDLVPGDPEEADRAFWAEFIRRGYEQGAGRAFIDTNPSALAESLAFYAGSREQFLRSAFAQPVSVERVKLLVGRVFTEMTGITDEMSLKLTRILADGLTRGLSPRAIAEEMVKQVDISTERALRMSRTEIIRAHAEGQLDGLEMLGVTHVGVMVEWSTAGDNRVCQACAYLQGTVWTIAEARGLIPRHPNCRCSFIPANVGEKRRGQIRRREDMMRAIESSLRAENPKYSLEEARQRSSWAGADVRISKTRPKSIIGEVEQ